MIIQKSFIMTFLLIVFILECSKDPISIHNTSGNPPPAPVLSYPFNGANVSMTPTLTWDSSAGATSYNLHLAIDSAFTSIVETFSTLTTTSLTIANSLIANEKYYWRLSATNANGMSKWSPVWSFTTSTSSWYPLSEGKGQGDYVVTLAFDGTDLYAGGIFLSGGYFISRWVATYSYWIGLGNGEIGGGMYGNSVDALAVDKSKNVYIGGWFSTAGSVAANNIAKWYRNAWSPLGAGMNDEVNALAVDSNGNIYAGGWFDSAGGVAANFIAKWNGSSWSPLGSGMNGEVNVLVVDKSGNLYAGGWFDTAGGVAANYIAKWDGNSWSPLGSGMDGGNSGVSIGTNVCALALDGSGNLYAGGYFTKAGGIPANYIAKWNGNSWSSLGSGLNNEVNALVVSGSGNLYAGGFFTTAGDLPIKYIAKWDSTTWSNLGSGINSGGVNALVLDNSGSLYAGGAFDSAGGVAALNIAKWE